ncbi:MAG: tRNA (guanosine(37)-N1)-methyltransferase TrmD [Gracilibacteraceae bacterium]|jgi:tRNA (guanine37-N1)-methyltransferase|nr:tRNA (guanosine(37)-N1)-methyltransferase TrmD [Gracilibacteraceae bacterium]
MVFWVLTLFPEMLECLRYSVVGKAWQAGIIDVRVVDYRQFAAGKHKCVDDSPYGGGGGMVLKVEPIVSALRSLPAMENVRLESEEARDASVSQSTGGRRVVLLSPQGKIFRQEDSRRLSAYDEVVFICGRYEGFDERVRAHVDEEISLGDYVVSGGELAAAVLIDAVARHIEGVLGNSGSALMESHAEGYLEYPHFTRPEVYEGMKVPAVLLSGNHADIERWRRKEALRRTFLRRPDLFDDLTFAAGDYVLLEELALEYPDLAGQRGRWQHLRPRPKRVWRSR